MKPEDVTEIIDALKRALAAQPTLVGANYYAGDYQRAKDVYAGVDIIMPDQLSREGYLRVQFKSNPGFRWIPRPDPDPDRAALDREVEYDQLQCKHHVNTYAHACIFTYTHTPLLARRRARILASSHPRILPSSHSRDGSRRAHRRV
eukprot:CAMPEP_0174583182 /NCGR_PEP_ID=MMETSP0929-20130131/12205_1 /TAXON_ID=548131 ORGANISM="Ostreococcus mediterraneus, Strain clade-D-RCC2572" /NCGR_SAMPLE_ID=MMETSP0929 /ASSEMBLY_ACC=CAM_ASM_000573 /LENGTH=146 /DNA_ID=CAMNT_0015765007 /DNA_START=231 /DNA_END=669 /DNA_ORIENTATION=+